MDYCGSIFGFRVGKEAKTVTPNMKSFETWRVRAGAEVVHYPLNPALGPETSDLRGPADHGPPPAPQEHVNLAAIESPGCKT